MSAADQVADGMVVAALAPIALGAPAFLGWVALYLVRGVRKRSLGFDHRIALIAALICLCGAVGWLSIDLRIVAEMIAQDEAA